MLLTHETHANVDMTPQIYNQLFIKFFIKLITSALLNIHKTYRVCEQIQSLFYNYLDSFFSKRQSLKGQFCIHTVT